MLEQALKISSKGFNIIPISFIGKSKGDRKTPLVDWGIYKDRKSTDEEIKAWWKKWPNANIGIVTGKISNLIVVDVEKGGSIDEYPKTLMVKTGGGGYHFYYRYKEGILNKVRIKPLTDIRTEGGYIVAPPSIHYTGNKYTWANIESINEFPFDLFTGLETRTPINVNEILNGVGEGTRNDILTRLTGKLMATTPKEEWSTTVWEFIKTIIHH
jgi:hypothetical protein